MKKALRITAIASGIISMVSIIILACLYMEDVVTYIHKAKDKVVNRIVE